MNIKIKDESDLNLIVMALGLAADKYAEYAETSAAVSVRLVDQWRKQQSDALRIADEIEAQS